MNEESFIKLRPYLYHLTCQSNLCNILNLMNLLSTQTIVMSSDISDKDYFLRTKRNKHETVLSSGFEYIIRDQNPISMLALSKCLDDGWSAGDFIGHLNKRVYFWCTLDRLWRHFNRYQEEKPVIIKCQTTDVLRLNPGKVEYCRINSGATRANAYLDGKAPPRGSDTFLPSRLFSLTPGRVVEVTVLDQCLLPDLCFVSNSPGGPWRKF